MSSHGGSQGPQMLHVCGRDAGLPWLYFGDNLFLEGVGWYCNCLVFAGLEQGLIFREADYCDPQRLARTLDKWDKTIDRMVARGQRWSSVFCAHPLMIQCEQFNDALNFTDGRNRTPRLVPTMRSEAQMAEAQRGFRHLVRWVRDHPKLRIRTIEQTARHFGGQLKRISQQQLHRFAQRVIEEVTWEEGAGTIPADDLFSPAEALRAWAEAIICANQASLPTEQPVVTSLGPMAIPSRQPDQTQQVVPFEATVALARSLVAFCDQRGHLPETLLSPYGQIGLGVLFVLLANVYRRLAEGQSQPACKMPYLAPAHPQVGHAIEAMCRHIYLYWPIHDLALDLEKLSMHLRLQSWTLKRVMER